MDNLKLSFTVSLQQKKLKDIKKKNFTYRSLDWEFLDEIK